MYLIIGLYHPGTSVGPAKTRAASLRGLLREKKFGTKAEIEKKVLAYVNTYGDGWDTTNTRRLTCFARFIDAVSDSKELVSYWDKTMAQWFQDKTKDGYKSLENERAFYRSHGVPIDEVEEGIQLQPGQLLIIDNMSAIHGRIGKRNAEEIYQFMFGVKDATPEDIDAFREHVVQIVKE